MSFKFRPSAKKIGLFFIYFYRSLFSLHFGGQCRFEPSCSHYAEDAVNKYPIHKALIKTLIRLLKCHPLSKGGYDPA